MTECQFWWASVEGRPPQVVEIYEMTAGHKVAYVTGLEMEIELGEVRLIERVLPAGRAAAAVSALGGLSEEERFDVLSRFCSHCGTEQGERRCQCWNDE